MYCDGILQSQFVTVACNEEDDDNGVGYKIVFHQYAMFYLIMRAFIINLCASSEDVLPQSN